MQKIYALVQQDGAIRYIGQTRRDLSIRLRQHLSEARSNLIGTHRMIWLRRCIRENKPPDIVLIKNVDDSDSDVAEMEMIFHHRLMGCKLVNTSAGPYGLYKRSNRTRKRMSGKRIHIVTLDAEYSR